MNRLITYLVITLIAALSFASDRTAQIERVAVLAAELAQARIQLTQNSQDIQSATTKIIISVAVAVTLGYTGRSMYNSNGGDLFGPGPQIFGTFIGASSIIPVSYGAFKGYQISVLSKNKSKLIKAISQKEAELHEAKKLFELSAD